MSVSRETSDLKLGGFIDSPNWFALCTNPKQEDRACSNLESWGVECFNPKIKTCHCNPFTGIKTFVPKPLFSRYIFSRFIARTLHDVIAIFKSRMDKDGFLNISEPVKPGDQIRIKGGPWQELVGVVERDLTASERVVVLLTTISYQGRLAIDKELVEKIS
jgi:transcription antitermination factor NusG